MPYCVPCVVRKESAWAACGGHTFCTSSKAWFKRHGRAGVDINTISYSPKYSNKIKAKLSYCNQIKFNGPEIKWESGNQFLYIGHCEVKRNI